MQAADARSRPDSGQIESPDAVGTDGHQDSQRWINQWPNTLICPES